MPKLKKLLAGLVLLQTLSFLTSCKKTDISSMPESDLVEKPGTAAKHNKATVTVEEYNAVIFDSCRAENVKLSGREEYKLIESFDNGYYIYYEIKLENVTGIGENTGTIYHGGGKILGTVQLSADGTDQKSRVHYRVKYVGNNGNKITFFQNARFVMRNGVVKIEFNDILDSCR